MSPIRRAIVALTLLLAACGGSAVDPVAAPAADPQPQSNTPDPSDSPGESSPSEEENTDNSVLPSVTDLDPESSDPCVAWSLSLEGKPTAEAVTTLTAIEGCRDDPNHHLTPTGFTCPSGDTVYYISGYGIGHQDGTWQARNWQGGVGAPTPEAEFC